MSQGLSDGESSAKGLFNNFASLFGAPLALPLVLVSSRLAQKIPLLFVVCGYRNNRGFFFYSQYARKPAPAVGLRAFFIRDLSLNYR